MYSTSLIINHTCTCIYIFYSRRDHSEIVQWIIYESDAKLGDNGINSVLDWSSK